MHIDLTAGAKRDTYVTFVLDETSSMSSIADQTISGFNEYLNSLKSDPGKGEVQLSLIKFNSVTGPTKMYVNASVRDVAPLSRMSYQPAGMTPLVDAVYEAILATDRAVVGRNVNVLVVVQTDGQENYSRQHTSLSLKQLVESKQALGWVLVFLGAGINAFSEAAQYGFTQDFTASYDRGNSIKAFSTMAGKTGEFRATGNAGSMSFNAGDRKELGGENQ